MTATRVVIHCILATAKVCLSYVSLVAHDAAASEVLSDRVVVLEDDARSHTVQHTLATASALVTLELPRSVIPQQTRFGGPERALFKQANQFNPQRLALWSGNAFTRYRHQYGDTLTQLDEGGYRLRTMSWPDQLQVELDSLAPEAVESVQTWVFPGNADVIDWRAVIDDDTRLPGEWSFEDNTLVWTQTGVASVELQIDYRIETPDSAPIAVAETTTSDTPAVEAKPAVELVVLDIDQDGVPDQRDACLSTAVDVDDLGCSLHEPRVLDEVRFSRGNSYLSPQARVQLTRTAKAILEHPDTIWEVAGYTDNAGSRTLNRQLSVQRAEAARQFLLLRGVPAGRVRAAGYGEETPIADNATAGGRAVNRRIELREWYAGQETPTTKDVTE